MAKSIDREHDCDYGGLTSRFIRKRETEEVEKREFLGTSICEAEIQT